jgi:hypothetical protein
MCREMLYAVCLLSDPSIVAILMRYMYTRAIFGPLIVQNVVTTQVLQLGA